jgi:hypothetical protein
MVVGVPDLGDKICGNEFAPFQIADDLQHLWQLGYGAPGPLAGECQRRHWG